MTERGWGRRFKDPVTIGNHVLVTLLDAGEYIAALPKKEHAAPEWQAAMEALILVAEGGGPTMFARIGIMRALNRHHVPSLTRRERSPIGAGASSRGISREAADRRGLTF